MDADGTGYEFFEHTADVGIRASGATQAELFLRMAEGLRALLIEDSPVAVRETRAIQLAAEDAERLLLAWLQELLFQFSTGGFLSATVVFEAVSPTALHAQLRGERFDPARHQQGREVKAITRHLLEVKQERGAWRGQVIVDV